MCVVFGLGGCGYVGVEVLERVEPEDKEDAGANTGGSSRGGAIIVTGGVTTGAVVSAGGSIMDASMVDASMTDASVDAGPPPCIVTCDPSLYENVETLSCDVDHCLLDNCANGFGDCDGLLENGCELSTSTLIDCGGCGVVCDSSIYPQVTAVICDLDEEACAPTGCQAGFHDCDGLPGNGCEATFTSAEHCGGCDQPCMASDFPHVAEVSCTGTSCILVACDEGFDDCDGALATGCETNLNTDSNNCGGCDAICTSGPPPTVCMLGTCEISYCDPGVADCDGLAGNGCEVALTTISDCGACDVSCGPLANASATCATGSCTVDQCDSGYGSCDGKSSNGCETAITTTSNCGACGNVCPAGIPCVGGHCAKFHYIPSNVNENDVDPSGAPDVVFNCGTTKFDSSTQLFTNACGNTLPTPIVTSQTTGGGLQIVILEFNNIQVSSGNILQIVGNKPVVIVAFGDATIAGTVESNASGITPGAGGDLSCGTSAGQNGTGNKDTGAGGGGGGGFGTKGGDGGDHGNDRGGSGGVLRGTDNLSPLLAGCLGGVGGGCSSNKGGGGGGAIQFSVVGTLSVTGTVRANGGVGTNGCSTEGGGGGGGSGGGILLEADVLQISGNVTANGGAGGDGRSGGRGGAGGTGTATAKNGQDESANGAGGGGGAVGRAFLRGIASCNIGGSVSAKTLTNCP